VNHSGKARQAALRLIFWTLALVALVLLAGFLARVIGSAIVGAASALVALWVVFAAFTCHFFRDPEPNVPTGPNLVVAPGHGTVDVIDESTEAEVLRGPCRRISMFLSVFNVHVQNAPVAGKVTFFRHQPGRYLNAMRSECVSENENVLIGFEPAERPGEKLGVRLVAGVIARRIVPWVAAGDVVARGERLSLIQFGSRVEVYLPLSAKIKVRLGDHVVGGETVVATLE
jgi:phosphatidylserine decarboxylase